MSSPTVRVPLHVALIAAGLLAARDARSAPLLTGPGGPTDFGVAVLSDVDDTSTAAIDLTTDFPGGLRIGAHTRSAMYINVNGSLSFGAPRTDFVPARFPDTFATGMGDEMIAAWFADVDLRPSTGASADNVFIRRGAEGLITTWYRVGAYSMHADLVDSFQIVLRPLPCGGCGDYEVQLRYDLCEWTTTDPVDGYDGGVPAAAGFDLTGGASLELPTSRTLRVVQMCLDSTGAVPGLWDFCVHGGVPTAGHCASDVHDAGVDVSVPDATIDRDGEAPDAFVADGGTDASVDEAALPDATTEDDATSPEPDAALPDDHAPGLSFHGGSCACDTRASSPARRTGVSVMLGCAAMAAMRRRRRRAVA